MKPRYLFILLALCFATAGLEAQTTWELCDIPTQMVDVVATAPNGHIFAVSLDGMYRSTDNGATWAATGAEITVPMITAIAAAPDGTLWAGSFARSPLVGPTYRSTDDGLTWHAITSAPTDVRVLEIVADGDIYAAKGNGIWRSSDNGVTWIGPTLDSLQTATIAVAANGDLLAGTVVGFNDRIYRSSDRGATWTPSDEGMRYANVNAIRRAPNGDLWAATYSHMPTDSNLYRSTDNGRSWKPVMMQDTWVTSIAFNARGEIFVGMQGLGFEPAGSRLGVWRSLDNGTSFSSYNTGLASLRVMALAANADGYLFAGTSNGLYRTSASTLVVPIVPKPLLPRTLEIVGANPSSGIFSLRYTIRSAAPATLTVVDMRGERVAELAIDRTIGEHEIEWRADAVPSGVYYCTLRNGEIVATEMMTVVR